MAWTANRPGPESATPAAQAAGAQTWLEFDIAESDDPLYFIVGYFADARSQRPLVTYRVTTAEARRTKEGAVRVPLHGWESPEPQSVVVRIRTGNAGGQGPWSEPGGPIASTELATLLPLEHGRGGSESAAEKAAKKATADAKAAARVKATEEALASNAELRQTLAKRFPSVNLDEAVKGYERLENFVAALEASKAHDLPFDQIKPDTTARRSALAAALQRLKPSIDAKREARKAQRQARQLIKSTKGRPEK